MAERRPIFSIIIPTRDRSTELGFCLQAISGLQFPAGGVEVIVVDDGGRDSSAAVCERFRGRMDVTLLTQVHAGPAAARNSGAQRATGRFLAFTDDDCRPKPDWLEKLAAQFARTPNHLVGGRTLNALDDNPYSITSQLILDLVYAYYNADPSRARFFASNNLALPAGLFREIGGFDTTFRTSEDRELCDRWRHHRFEMTYAPEAIIYRAHDLTSASFLRQHFGYGRGAFRFHRVRTGRSSGRFVSELDFYSGLPPLVCRALMNLGAKKAASVAALLVAWQAANAAGFFWEMNQSKKRLRAAENRGLADRQQADPEQTSS